MIHLENVIKDYRSVLPGLRGSSVRALDGVTAHVTPGTALGIIGLNGAGKSTLLNLLLGYLRATSGSAPIGGLEPRAYAQRHGVSYIPERVAIPPKRSVRGALEAYAMLGNAGLDAQDRVNSAINRLGLTEFERRRVGTLSKGNLQRLAVAQTLLADRKLMVLDEPTDGLDPVWVAELRKIIGDWRRGDPERVLIVASHNLPEVERLTDRVLVLHAGRVREEIDLRGAKPGSPKLEERFLELVSGWSEAA
ncbi:MAG: ABC transporter ATP-binding protein [Gemmatimonadetes bacterium]|nr:ABC transporter ATP-binding protein [Gemmatimonadota bacterium]